MSARLFSYSSLGRTRQTRPSREERKLTKARKIAAQRDQQTVDELFESTISPTDKIMAGDFSRGPVLEGAHLAAPPRRSLALPIAFATLVAMMLLTFAKPYLAHASTGTAQSTSALIEVETSPADCHAIDGVNDSRQRVRCPLNLVPGATILEARIHLGHNATGGQTTTSRCTLFSRHMDGGQARGVSVQQSDSGTGWKSFSTTDRLDGDFRYIECDLAPNATLGTIEVKAENAARFDTRQLKQMIDQLPVRSSLLN